MAFQPPIPRSGSASSTAAMATAWDAHVSSALAARKNKATEAQIARLTKTLARLDGAAASVMARVPDRPDGRMDAARPASFAAALETLSHG